MVFRANPAPLLLIVMLSALCIAAAPKINDAWAGGPSDARAPTFVGEAVCAGCHASEANRWRGSHHELAMQPASERTVLGDFKDCKFVNHGITSTFFRRGAKFMVRTDGPDGAYHDYEIKFTFGTYPLQQYLIAMPGGRLQALGAAWDSRPAAQGGQRWFFLISGKILTARDPLHWTGIDQNWNFMCADCHSTNVRRNYDPRTRTFSTSYDAVSVSCEACHGPGSNHVGWAKRQGEWQRFESSKGLTIALDERRGVIWSRSGPRGKVQRNRPRESQREIQMCARCHSRRSQIHEDYVHGQPIGDDYRVALLDRDLYFPDGQIKAEDYEYGSFIQSRMFHAGVTCSDCHEPHSSKLRADGNGVCLQCHAPRYDSPGHHFHKLDSAGARCVNCHMPSRTYMVVDQRRDHSLRVPRPDLSEKLGVPNACTACHTNKSPQWAMAAMTKWYGHSPAGFQRFAETLSSAVEGAPGSRTSIEKLIADRGQPAIARATALSLLANYSPSPDDPGIHEGTLDSSPLVRRAAAHALSNSNLLPSIAALAPLLDDPVRAVRIEAGEVLAGAPRDRVTPEVAAKLEKAIDEYVASQKLLADRPESHLNLGLLYAREGRLEQAEAEFKLAMSLDPAFVPAAVNLADLYRAQNRDRDGERVLETALARTPDDPSLEYAMGLLMAREKNYAGARERLAKAARGDPTNARYAFTFAVALNDSGQRAAAISELKAALQSHPYDRDCLNLLTALLVQSGDAEALAYAQRLSQLEPDDQDLRNLISQLRGARKP